MRKFRFLIIPVSILSTLLILAVAIFKILQPPTISAIDALNRVDMDWRGVVCSNPNSSKALSILQTLTDITYIKAGESNSFSEKAEALQSACLELSKTDPIVRTAVDSLKALKAKWREEDRLFAPDIKVWNSKATLVGGGTYLEFLRAQELLTDRLARGGFKNRFGGSVQVQGVACEPSIRSRWKQGFATGWWRCAIDLVGEEVRVYSVEAAAIGVSASPDSGARAGAGVSFKTPKGFNSWLKRNCEGWSPRSFCGEN
jgi:hypothetical protein